MNPIPRKYRNIAMVVGALVVVGLLAYFLTPGPRENMHHLPPTQNPNGSAPQGSQGSQQSSNPTMVLFWADWCGHSKAIKPKWDAVCPVLRNANITTVEVDDKTHADQIKAMGIKGFPTVRFYPDGFPSNNFIEYHGDRSEDSLVKFGYTSGAEQ